jgi:hypothetical protein
VGNLASYQQLKPSYQQVLVDCHFHYKTPTIKADFIMFNGYPSIGANDAGDSVLERVTMSLFYITPFLCI